MKGIVILLLVSLLAMGCAKKPEADIARFESFEMVQLGDFRYNTPMNVSTSSPRRGMLVHDYVHAPNTQLSVHLDLTPPRSLKLDGESEMRRFLTEIPRGQVQSVQYQEVRNLQNVRIFADGFDRNGNHLSGQLVMTRIGDKTMIFRAIGPMEEAEAITRLFEWFVRSLEDV